MEEKIYLKEKEYQEYVEAMTPKANLLQRIMRAFVAGGAVCALGQLLINCGIYLGQTQEKAGTWASLLLVLLGVILTGFSLFQKIAIWAGAGVLVPITGFANGIASAAIEYKKEGQVFGIGVKIFTIAGPVILYGILTSWVLGVLYYIGNYCL